jgi:pimeloyl-ACP methyl ester carboxylesterase
LGNQVLLKVFLAIVVCVFLFAGLTYWYSYRNDLRAETDFPPIGAFVTVDNTRVHYLRQGSGPAVILLHGAGGNIRDFDLGLMDRIAQNYTVFAFDRPGHGYTDQLHANGESPKEQAQLLAAAAKSLGVSNAIIAGYSYGGAVALAWSLDQPEMAKGILLLSAVSNPWDTPISALYTRSALPIIGPAITTIISAYAPQSAIDKSLTDLFAPQHIPQGYQNHFGVALTLRQKSMRSNGLQVSNLLPFIREQSRRYTQLTLPVEIIHGAQDTTVPAQVHAAVLARQLPQARLTIMPELGHNTQHYAQDEILAALARISID